MLIMHRFKIDHNFAFPKFFYRKKIVIVLTGFDRLTCADLWLYTVGHVGLSE